MSANDSAAQMLAEARTLLRQALCPVCDAKGMAAMFKTCTWCAERNALVEKISTHRPDSLRGVDNTDEPRKLPPYALEIGLSQDERDVVLNHPEMTPTPGGPGGHIIFTPKQARDLAALLIKKAGECKGQTHAKQVVRGSVKETAMTVADVRARLTDVPDYVWAVLTDGPLKGIDVELGASEPFALFRSAGECPHGVPRDEVCRACEVVAEMMRR